MSSQAAAGAGAGRSLTTPLASCTLLNGEDVLAAHSTCRGSTDERISDFCLLSVFEPRLRAIIYDCLGPFRIFPQRTCMSLRVDEGWNPSKCTDQAIRILLVEKVQALLVAAAARKATPRTEPIAQGFWYANEFLAELAARNEQQQLAHYRKMDAFYSGLPPQGFKQIEDAESATGIQISAYTLADAQTTPSVALANVERTLCFVDCQTALLVGGFQVAQTVFGRYRFDRLFAYEGQHPLRLEPNFMATPLTQFFSRIRVGFGAFGARPVQVGDMTYFLNYNLYSARNPNGEWGGIHVLCTQTQDVQLFTGFGLPPQGITEGEIYDLFVAACKDVPVPLSQMCSPQLAARLQASFDQENVAYAQQAGLSLKAYCDIIKNGIVTREKFIQDQRKQPGVVGFVGLVTRPNVEAMTKALAAPLVPQTVPKKEAKSPPAAK